MPSSQRFTITSLFLAIIFCLSLVHVNSVLADDHTPTEPPPATETPVEISATPVPPTEGPVEPATATPDPAEGAAAETEQNEADASVTELITEIPDGTDLLVLDDQGAPVSLASQQAVNIFVEADPMWCPQGVAPNGPGCTGNLTISALLALMQTNAGGMFSQNGVIYFERATNTTYTAPFILDESAGSLGASYNAIKSYNITLQGGWAGGSSSSITGQTDFLGASAFVQVGSNSNPWVGNVTINDIKIGAAGAGNGVSTNNSLTVHTTDGDISLSNVDVRQQQGNHYDAYLQSVNGNITVGANANGNPSLFDGDNSSGKENKGFSATTATGSITISNTTFQDALANLANRNDGATLSAPVVTLSNVTISDADGNGVVIKNANTVTLNNVTSGFINPSLGNPNHGNGLSGVLVNGNGSTVVNIFGGTLQDNGRYGVELINSILNEQAAPTCTNNGLGTVANPCYNVTPTGTATSTPTEIPTQTGTPVPGPTNPPLPTSTLTTISTPTGPGGVIPATGGSLIDLGCLTTVNVFGIRVTFFNLCSKQANLNQVGSDQLPHPLPEGTTMLAGLEVLVVNEGRIVASLPDRAGIQMDFPRPAGARESFAVIHWNTETGQWTEIRQEIDSSEISGVLKANPADELYIVTPAATEGAVYKILTTEKTGIFVLIRK